MLNQANFQKKSGFGQIYVGKGSNTIVFVHEIKNFRVK